MRICRNDLVRALSGALDYVEREIMGVDGHHGMRVAYLVALTGKAMGMGEAALGDLVVVSTLHDNAFTQFWQVFKASPFRDNTHASEEFGKHCVYGERNISTLAFYPAVKGAILYHHENADGSGPFGKTAGQTPLFAQLIHLADRIDLGYNLYGMDGAKIDLVREKIFKEEGKSFSPCVAEAFLDGVDDAQLEHLGDEMVMGSLNELVPRRIKDYQFGDLEAIGRMFAKIVDYKSHFTCTHSIGIAEKAKAMARFYHWNEEKCTKMFLTGALHDIGKLTIPNAILEKPARLTKEEFEVMKNHALASWNILSGIEGMDDIQKWGALHHEKLDGSGYPFGLTAKDLGFEERLMAVLDIYQALTEFRPYKEGMSHEGAMTVLRTMMDDGKLDEGIVHGIDLKFNPRTRF
ncbi:MAG: HD domain-containing phosphohydrolase [Sphaerochaetaceae bacterium]|jgi:HD-GYP domain-containing protein (c-di-GMP phosphodiesterase class II)